MMKRQIALLLAAISLCTTGPLALAQEGDLQRSEKLTLFVYPMKFSQDAKDMPDRDREWAREKFRETFVTTFERFDYVEMPAEANLDSFLANADVYMGEHAREFVQFRKQTDGRIGEARVTLKDLMRAVDNGYVFMPVFEKAEWREPKKEEKGDPHWFIETSLEIWHTASREKITTLHANSLGLGALVGAFKQIATGEIGATGDSKRQELHNNVDGIYEDLKHRVRQMDQFSLKAVAFNTSLNHFSIDLGHDFGVRMDRQYMAWSQDAEGNRTEMNAWGKVRHVHPNSADLQTLIGRVGEGDQVVEFSRIGLNLTVFAGITPFETDGFNEIEGFYFNITNTELGYTLPSDSKSPRAQLGLSLEYDLAPIINVTELYIVLEGSVIPVPGVFTSQGMGGLRKKYYFRRFGLYWTLKGGVINAEFLDTEIFDDENVDKGPDGTVFGLGADAGFEFWLSPRSFLRAQASFQGFPEQMVILVIDQSGDLRDGRIASAGIAYTVTLGFNL